MEDKKIDGRSKNHGMKGHKGGTGRPPLPPELKSKRKIRTFRLTDEEYETVRDFIKSVMR